jgi:hypothetical protein
MTRKTERLDKRRRQVHTLSDPASHVVDLARHRHTPA